MKPVFTLALFLVFVSAGCGYNLQGKAELPFSEVAIGEIRNNTAEPKLQDKMHKFLAETFMEYGVDIRNSARYRIEGEITKFLVYPVAEKDLKAIEYKLDIAGNFRIADTENVKSKAKTDINKKKSSDEKASSYSWENIGTISNPYPTYFRSSDLLVSVIAAKEAATEKAIKELSQELVLRIIYKLPSNKSEKKSGVAVESEAVSSGNR